MHTYEQTVLRLKAHQELEIPRYAGEHLIGSGYYRSIGSPRGQIDDYRRRLPDGRGIHIRDYGNRMTMHWDHVDPSTDLIGHLIQDAPLFALAAAIIGAAVLGSRA